MYKKVKTTLGFTHSELTEALRKAGLLGWVNSYKFTGCSGPVDSENRMYYFETTEYKN